MQIKRTVRVLALLIMIVIALTGMAQALSPNDYDASAPQKLSDEMLYASTAVLMDADSGDVLYSKNATQRMHPASTTKIMTLLLGVESGTALDRVITIPQASSQVPNDSSLIPVFPGEELTFGDLLTSFTVSSGNDGANAIAVLVAGTIDDFVAMMNERAAQIGCRDTHFVNTHGYTAQDHYSSAYDLALITREAMKNPLFREIVATTQLSFDVYDRQKNKQETRKVSSKQYIMLESSEFYDPECIGVKTGSTDAAGKCFVGAAERNGVTIISVVMKCDTEDQRWIDTQHIFDFGWTCYDRYTLDQMYRIAAPEIGAHVVISNAASDDFQEGRMELEIAQLSSSGYLRMVERNRAGALEEAVEELKNNCVVSISHNLTAPIMKGEIMGDFSFRDPGSGEVVTARLIASRDIAEKTVFMAITEVLPFLKIFGNETFILLLLIIALIIVLLIIWRITRKIARQRRRRKIYERKRAEYIRKQQRGRVSADDEDEYDRVPVRRVNSTPRRNDGNARRRSK